MEDEPKAPEPLRASTKRGREEADHAGSPPKRARTDAQPTSELRALESAQSPMSGMAYLVVAFVGAKFDFVARCAPCPSSRPSHACEAAREARR